MSVGRRMSPWVGHSDRELPGGLWAALGLAEGWDWVGDALCAQTDPEVFYPDKGESNAAAKRVCMVCPARVACLEAALARNEPFGVWGGMSEVERRQLRPVNSPARGVA